MLIQLLPQQLSQKCLESFRDAAEVTYGGQGTDYGIGYWYWMNLLWHSGPTFYLIDMMEDNNDPRLDHICVPGEDGIHRGTTEIGRQPERADLAQGNRGAKSWRTSYGSGGDGLSSDAACSGYSSFV